MSDHGVYVHVPWCRARCPYCAFAVVPGAAPPDWRPYVAKVLAEAASWAPAFPGRGATLYLGGGTPSRLPVAAIAALVAGLGAGWDEVTVECNPEDAAPAWLDGVVAAGVTRISLGVQSTVPAVARRLGRGHTQAHAAASMARVAASGVRSWSADLMFAVPGQALGDLDRDLDALLEAGVPHVSLYGLTFEPGTRFDAARQRARGGVTPVDDDLWRAMYDRIVERLHGAGIRRYEVSNFARPGHEARHNAGYWADRPYLGLGPSAHGYAPDGTRWVNRADLADWLAADDPTASRERPDPWTRAVDRLVSGVRAAAGLELGALGVPVDDREVERLVTLGAIVRTGDRIALTDAGFPICDAVVGRLVDALQAEPPVDPA
ncbi:MAG: coproporphyrinogen-III oxidase family protein [Myxococcota bacterium]